MKLEGTISIIIPVFNEESNVIPLYKEIIEHTENLNKSSEIIWVNDGSQDRTLEELKTLKQVKIINLRKNFGQTAAWLAGFNNAKGDYIIIMDGDGQNNPKDIPLLIENLEKGYDFVSGWRYERKDNGRIKLLSKFGNFIRRKLTGDTFNDSGCSLKIYRRECLENIELYGEMHRYIHSLLIWKGFKGNEIKVNHRPRKNGKTKYSWRKNIKGLIDLLYIWFTQKYTYRPLHLFGGIGIVSITTSVLIGIYLIYMKYMYQIDVSNTAYSIIAVGLFLFGVQLFISGIITDLITKTKLGISNQKPYSIKEIIKNE